MSRISSNDECEFGDNFSIAKLQGTTDGGIGENAVPTTFRIGLNNRELQKYGTGKYRVGRQKFSIKNPYAPSGKAGTLLFSILNYSIPQSEGNLMYFPPYISSMNNSDNANWNAIDFLGRPEPLYTYKNGTRDASITFFVLTDYSTKVLIGRKGYFDESQDEMLSQVFFNGNKNFTDAPDAGLLNAAAQQTSSLIQSAVNQPGSINDAQSQTQISNLKSQMNNLTNSAASSIGQNNLSPYSESSSKGNIYDFEVSQIETTGDGTGVAATTLADTLTRLNDMNRYLLFQPAFFSGSLVDFSRRITFLSRCTRPALNNTKSGFSFTNPPVCHIKLGDWWDHDAIINSVTYDYSDVPWTVTDTSVQPMWLGVTINFNMVGAAGNAYSNGLPLLSTDKTGYFASKAV